MVDAFCNAVPAMTRIKLEIRGAHRLRDSFGLQSWLTSVLLLAYRLISSSRTLAQLLLFRVLYYLAFLAGGAGCFLAGPAFRPACTAFFFASTTSFSADASSILACFSSLFPDATSIPAGFSSYFADSPSLFDCASSSALCAEFFFVSTSFKASSVGFSQGSASFSCVTPT